jgi:glycosyltransferase involved in cell wall biosynthesis
LDKVQRKKTVFVVVGRLGETLTESKVIPFITNTSVEKCFIFRETKGFRIQNAEYVTLDSFLSKFGNHFFRKVVRFITEPIQLIMYAIRHKPYLINGVFTLPKGLNAVIASKISGTKSVVSVIGGTVEITTRMPGTWFWKRLNLWILKNCDAVTTKGSKVTTYLVEQGIPSDKIFNLNGSIDSNRFFPDSNKKKDIDILFVGMFSILKGPDRVLNVVENFVESGKNIRAVFLGEGSMYSEIEHLIKEKGLEDVVSLKGYCNDTAPYFQRAKTLLMPSTSEGLPTAMLEAMACGCVPVVSDVGNITDAADHEQNSMVIKTWDDIDSFTKATDRLISDSEFRNRLAKNGRKTVEERYTPFKQAEIVEQIFQYLNQ